MEQEVTRVGRKKAAAKTKVSNPDYTVHKQRLSKVKGQIGGIERMIDDRRYCPDIMNQLRAACAALKVVESEIFKTHLRGCVRSAMSSNDSIVADTKVEEIMKMFYKS